MYVQFLCKTLFCILFCDTGQLIPEEQRPFLRICPLFSAKKGI